MQKNYIETKSGKRTKEFCKEEKPIPGFFLRKAMVLNNYIQKSSFKNTFSTLYVVQAKRKHEKSRQTQTQQVCSKNISTVL